MQVLILQSLLVHVSSLVKITYPDGVKLLEELLIECLTEEKPTRGPHFDLDPSFVLTVETLEHAKLLVTISFEHVSPLMPSSQKFAVDDHPYINFRHHITTKAPNRFAKKYGSSKFARVSFQFPPVAIEDILASTDTDTSDGTTANLTEPSKEEVQMMRVKFHRQLVDLFSGGSPKV